MKSKVTIYFEEPYDIETEEIHNSLSEEQKETFYIKFKQEIENVVRSEFAKDIENLKITFEVE